MGLVLRLCRREKRRGLAAFSLTASGRGEFLISPFQSLRRQAFREAPGLSACTACSAAPKPGSRRPETAALTAASRHGKISVSSPLRPALEAKACLRAASAGTSGDFCYIEENTCPSCCVFLPSFCKTAFIPRNFHAPAFFSGFTACFFRRASALCAYR